MADERDPQVSRRYRELGSDEPPRALDDRILEASRRAVAPRRRWYVPLAAAAVALLAVGVVLQVEHERPALDTAAVPSEAQGDMKANKEAAPAPLPQTAPAARARQESSARTPAQGGALQPSPERLLERIAELRKLGRHDEADKALAELRRRYPDFKIPKDLTRD